MGKELQMTDEDRPMVHIRLPKPLVRRVDHLAVDWDTDRARAVERLLRDAVPQAEERSAR